MTQLEVTRNPLCWPAGWPRTSATGRKTGRYRVSLVDARDHVLEQLGRLHATGVILSSNLALRGDGLPAAQKREPLDPGIAVYFYRRGQQQVIACDVWLEARANMRAIGVALESLRRIELSGSGHLLDRAFLGFAALPPAGQWWRDELKISPNVALSEDVILAAFRLEALKRHPDHGGDDQDMVSLIAARNAALAALATGEGA